MLVSLYDPEQDIQRYKAELARVSGPASLLSETARRLRYEMEAIGDAIDNEQGDESDLAHEKFLRDTLRVIESRLLDLRDREDLAIRGLESCGFNMSHFKR